MDLKSKSLIELKAMAYDELANQEYAQKNLQIINQEISRRLSFPAQTKKVEYDEKRGEVADDTQPVSEGK